MRVASGALFASGLVGIFYLLTGVISLAYMHEAFWGVFVVLGALALVLSALLGLAASGGHAAPTRDQATA